MALAKDSRQEEELKLLLRTQFNYELARQRIKFKYDVLQPEVEKLRAGKGVLGLADGTLFEIVKVDAENPRPTDPATNDADADGA
jgi:hypothetical protein